MQKEGLTIVNNPASENVGVVRLSNERVAQGFTAVGNPVASGKTYRLGARLMLTPSGAPGTVSSATWYFGLQSGSYDNIMSGTVNHFIGVKLTGASLLHQSTDDHYGAAVVQPCLIQNNSETLGTSVYTGVLAGRGPNELCSVFLELDFTGVAIGYRMAGLTYSSPASNRTQAQFFTDLAGPHNTVPSGSTYSTVQRTISWTTDMTTDLATYGALDTVVMSWDQTDPTLEIATWGLCDTTLS